MAGQIIGPRAAAVLAVAGLAGAALGVHGWTGRHHGLPPGLAGPGGSGTPAAHAASSSPAGSGPTQGPVVSRSSPAAASSAAAAPGPKLSSQSYASYAFQVWPGPVSAAAKAAQTGLVITVRRQGSGLLVAAGVAGQGKPTSKLYPGGTKVYVIEASMGDDSGSDFNLGDDGLVVTDAQGRIL